MKGFVMDILIVDDEAKIRNGLHKLLASHAGWNVVGAYAEAAGAFEYLSENPVDVIVTDIRMPGLSGLDLIRQLREVNIEAQIIILSGYGEFSYAQQAIALGVARYLTKPTNTKELMQVLAGMELACSEKLAKEPPADTEMSNLIVAKTVEYIEANFYQKITLKDVAGALYVTPNYLCRLFKRHTGRHLSDYLLEYRMDKARALLRNPQYKIAEVAEKVGYGDTKYFSTSFKKVYHMTPMDYRNGKNFVE